MWGLQGTHRPLSSSFLWLILRTLSGNPKRELLKGPMGKVEELPYTVIEATSRELLVQSFL